MAKTLIMFFFIILMQQTIQLFVRNRLNDQKVMNLVLNTPLILQKIQKDDIKLTIDFAFSK